MTMNPAIKERWLKALRSGDYRQGARTLRSQEGFCCLGVLCDLATQDEVASWGEPGNEDPNGEDEIIIGVQGCCTPDGDESKGLLPPDICRWAGLVEARAGERESPMVSPYVRQVGVLQPLCYLNDEQGLSFPEIADLIEASL